MEAFCEKSLIVFDKNHFAYLRISDANYPIELITARKVSYSTKYMVMSRDQNAGRIQSVKIDNSTFEKGGRIKIFGDNFNKSKFYCGRN